MDNILNLSQGFEPFGGGINYDSFLFPSKAELQFKIKTPYRYSHVVITSRINSSDDIMRLLLATDALRRIGVKHIDIYVPYFPYARQDRVMVDGEALSVKVMADLMNSQNYDSVYILDSHSDVAPALINNCISISNHEFVMSVLSERKDYLLISPDAGAYKKIFKLAQYLNYKDRIVLCNKVRDVSTGQIIETTIGDTNLTGKICVIVDDICDGGGTFVLLANELKSRGASYVILIVTHGIFSRGTVLSGVDHIYSTDSFSTLPNHGQFTQIKLYDGLLS